MPWTIVDTALLASRPSRVVPIDIPEFPDRIDYEGIIGRAFSSPSDLDFLASGGVICLATRDKGIHEMSRLADLGGMLRKEGLIQELRRINLQRQIVALEYRP